MYEEKVISYFKKVSSIPRASGDEKAIGDYIMSFAKERGFDARRDSVGNVIVRKPASNCISEKNVILQSHMDMVYVKEKRSNHQYQDGITVLEDDSCYYSKDTSLGADNGIALAYCLAILDSQELIHPNLEMIFTVKEEVGLIGAAALDMTDIKGDQLINLDSEEEGVYYSSCAGGLRCTLFWDFDTTTVQEEYELLSVRIEGLRGGHSGINIGMGLGNAIVLLGRVLYALKDYDIRVNEIEAAGKANAIPNAGILTLLVKSVEMERIIRLLSEQESCFQKELEDTDTIWIRTEKGGKVSGVKCYSPKDVQRLIEALLLLPCGVERYSYAVKGLVETSVNIGSLTMEAGRMALLMFIRSASESQKYLMRDRIRIIAEHLGDEISLSGDYPGWRFKKESPLREQAMLLYERMFQKSARLAAIHAGLECGYWDYKRPGIDMISIGPDLYDVHSVKERVSKRSIYNVWEYLKELLKELI